MRDFVHVRDVARAFRLAMESPFAVGHVINIGSGHAYTIAQVAEHLADAMGMPQVAPLLLNKARAEISAIASPISARHATCSVSSRSTSWKSCSTSWCIGSEDQAPRDRGEDAKRQLEARGLVT